MGTPDGAHTHGSSSGSGLGTVVLVIVAGRAARPGGRRRGRRATAPARDPHRDPGRRGSRRRGGLWRVATAPDAARYGTSAVSSHPRTAQAASVALRVVAGDRAPASDRAACHPFALPRRQRRRRRRRHPQIPGRKHPVTGPQPRSCWSWTFPDRGPAIDNLCVGSGGASMTRPRGCSFPGSSGRGRRGAVALGVVAAVAIGAAACGGSSSAAPAVSAAPAPSSAALAASTPVAVVRLHLPAQLFGLNKNTGRAAKQLSQDWRKGISLGSSLVRSPKAAIYGALYGGTPYVIVFAAKWSSAGARQVASAAVEKRAAREALVYVSSGSTGVQSFPAGPHGGALACGHGIHGHKGLVCVWADKLTVGGVVYIFRAASSLSDAASKTNQAQSAVEA